MSAAWKYLRDLQVGDAVPAELYVLDYADGGRPRWQVHSVTELGSGQRVITVVDPDNGSSDLFDDRARVALTVITWPAKTMRSQPHMLGTDPPGMLCDMDQQGRHAARRPK